VKRCFVIQGYGQKTDYSNGRVLDLDASYAVIKEAVEDAGLECIRCDEIAHSGVIDVPMYQQLLEADLVIADLSTYNINAAFELGVRYALRPHCTLIVAESQFRNPFDTSHTVMLSYEHLGKDVGAQEARRFRRALKGQIEALRAAQRIDSPVYTYLPQLQPPAAVQASTPRSAPVLEAGGAVAMLTTGATAAVPEPAGRDLSLKQLLETAQQLVDQRLYAPAASLLEELRRQRPHDSDITQRLALAIYKSEQPDAQTALHAARELLRELNPASTNDPQTLGLWGAIHKRLWEHRAHAPYLDASIEGYERGFYLKQDHYNGINLAFMLDVRGELAASSGDMANAITDHTLAARVRREVLRWCADQAERLREVDPMDRYWVLASLWEASLGLGDEPGRLKWEAQLATITVPEAMRTTRERQATQLRDLLASARMRGMPIGAAPNRAADDAVIAPPAIPRERQDSALPASPGG
jgi:tetratricopeptide (TPR) repeat protein